MQTDNIPRALRSMPRAETTDPKALIGQLNNAFKDFKADHYGRLESLENSIEDLYLRNASERLGGSGGEIAGDPEYSQVFASYFKRGDAEGEVKRLNGEGWRANVQAAMSVGTDSDGGYLAPVEWDRRIRQALVNVSPMRRLAEVKVTTVNAYSTVWNNAQWGSGWVGETATRPQTTSANLSPITFAHGEIYAQPAITQRLLDDAGLNMEQWLASEVQNEFARQEAIAFISGNGTNKPFGLLQYVPGGAAESEHPAGTLGITNSGDAATIPNTDILVDFTYELGAPYRQNATWLMNGQTAAFIAKMKDGDGNYIWRESLTAGQPSQLLGRPVEIDEGMPNIGAGNLPIAFGDFRAGYVINDRTGIRVLRDPYTAKGFVLFYATKRVGGGVQDPNAIRLLQIAA